MNILVNIQTLLSSRSGAANNNKVAFGRHCNCQTAYEKYGTTGSTSVIDTISCTVTVRLPSQHQPFTFEPSYLNLNLFILL